MLTQKNNTFLSLALTVTAIITSASQVVCNTQNEALDSKPHSSSNLCDKTTEAGWIILDGTRNVSFNMVHLLASQNIPCTVLVKPHDMVFADAKLPRIPLVTLLECDFTDPHFKPQSLTFTHESKYLFMDPEHDVYKEWHTTVTTIAKNAIALAKTNHLTIFYPARVYVFNNQEVITDESLYNPITEQGMTLMKIEYMLKCAVQRKSCKVRKIRMSYPFGPAVFDYLLSSTFKEVPTQGRMTWLFRTDKPHQFCFVKDVARIALQLSTYKTDHEDITIHYSGYTYPSVEEFGTAICQVAGVQLKPRVVSKFQLSLVAIFQPNAERGSDLTTYFEQPVYMEDSKELVEAFSFTPTPPELAFKETLDWFGEFGMATRTLQQIHHTHSS
jgi:nucleoside-diphosphate-sugar epimerase